MEGRTEPIDQQYIRKQWECLWGLPVVSTRRTCEPEEVQGLVYRGEWGEAQGLITWHIEGDSAEMVTVNAYQQGRHIGGRLLNAAEAELQKRGVSHIMIVGHVPSSGVKARQPHNWVKRMPCPVAPPPSAQRSSR